VTVHNDLDYQKDWIKETFYDYDIENLILVGGESNDIKYPGPSVNETSEYITRDLNAGRFDFFCGGITIPSRKIESVRLLKKGSNGIEFFTSQVLYDGKKIKKMLKYYDDVCKENNVLPRRILLSFAPVSSKKNIDFLKWLGVEIPSQTEKRLTNKKTSMSDESLEIASEILKGILNNNEKLGITVPIGLNVEHIMSYNFQSSINMLQELSKIYREFCIKTSLYD
jgi:5,10-methylenetetrahydrofolate reductase